MRVFYLCGLAGQRQIGEASRFLHLFGVLLTVDGPISSWYPLVLLNGLLATSDLRRTSVVCVVTLRWLHPRRVPFVVAPGCGRHHAALFVDRGSLWSPDSSPRSCLAGYRARALSIGQRSARTEGCSRGSAEQNIQHISYSDSTPAYSPQLVE